MAVRRLTVKLPHEEQASYEIKVWVEVAGCYKMKELSCVNEVNWTITPIMTSY